MRTRKEMKKAAKHVLKTHYVLLVFACLFIAFVGSEFSNSLTFTRESVLPDTEEGAEVQTQTAASQLNMSSVLHDMLESKDANVGKDEAESLKTQMVDQSKDGNQALGRTRGVLAGVVNSFTSGSVFVTIFAGLNSIFRSDNAAVAVFIILSTLLMIVFWFFFENILKAVIRRIFLESRTYEKVSITQFIFFFRVRRWTKVAWVMFVEYFYKVLWFFTIVGAFIKHYSYAMVPFIIAENPSLKANEAITLSRRMMKGHKWQCFVLDWTFFGWQLLGVVTFGLSNILFLDPYMIATYTEIYADLRKNAIDNHLDGYEAFNDIYLFQKPEQADVQAAYTDVVEMMNQPMEEVKETKGILGFIANVFGIIPVYGEHEKAYEKNEVQKVQIAKYRDIMSGKRYPNRLFTIPEAEKRKRVVQMRYLRRYSIWSIILLFFSFAFIGWVWEVSLHLISDGQFVNRGVLHGPWLPIYGTGGILILVLLNKFREHAATEFVAAVVLCGFVEYFTSYYLEMSHGQKWWDYSGYFLNLNGRICAEGLLVFGLGGMAIVYFVAPMLDNLFRMIQFQIIVPICLVLVCCFGVDQAYSGKHPNMGKGITDYESHVEIQLKETEWTRGII